MTSPLDRSEALGGRAVLVPADAVVYRPADIVDLMQGRPLKAVAVELGIGYTTLWRFMRDNGYSFARVMLSEAGAST